MSVEGGDEGDDRDDCVCLWEFDGEVRWMVDGHDHD